MMCSREVCPTAIRQDFNAWFTEVSTSLPTVVVAAKDSTGADLSDVSVTVDGELLTARPDGKALPVDPGPRVFRFERKGERKDVRVVVRQGEHDRLVEVTFGDASGPQKALANAPTARSEHDAEAPDAHPLGAQRG